MHQPADVVARCDAIESIYAKARLEAMGLFEELSELVPFKNFSMTPRAGGDQRLRKKEARFDEC